MRQRTRYSKFSGNSESQWLLLRAGTRANALLSRQRRAHLSPRVPMAGKPLLLFRPEFEMYFWALKTEHAVFLTTLREREASQTLQKCSVNVNFMFGHLRTFKEPLINIYKPKINLRQTYSLFVLLGNLMFCSKYVRNMYLNNFFFFCTSFFIF